MEVKKIDKKFKWNEKKKKHFQMKKLKTQINKKDRPNLLTFRRDRQSRAVIETAPSCSVHQMECRQSDTMQRDQTSPPIRSINKMEN